MGKKFEAIARALRMDSFADMGEELGLDEDETLIDWEILSGYPHTNIMMTRNFVKAGASNTFRFDSMPPAATYLGYVMRGSTKVLALATEVHSLFPDGAKQHEAELWGAEVNAFEHKIKHGMSVPSS
jgi:hypothetical protein